MKPQHSALVAIAVIPPTVVLLLALAGRVTVPIWHGALGYLAGAMVVSGSVLFIEYTAGRRPRRKVRGRLVRHCERPIDF